MSQLDCLTALPGVKHIGLRNNRISRTTSFAQSRPPLTFSKTVSDVDVSSNLISEWSFVNQLSHMFPGLTALRLSSNPLYEDLADAEGAKLVTNDAFMLTIARLADLQALNHSKVGHTSN